MSSVAIRVDYHAPHPEGSEEALGELLTSRVSSGAFQLSYAMNHFAFTVGWKHPKMAGRRIPVTLGWTPPDEQGISLPQLASVDEGGEPIVVTYSQSSFRGAELLRNMLREDRDLDLRVRQIVAQTSRSVRFVGRPASVEEAPMSARERRRRGRGTPKPFHVLVPRFPVLQTPIELEDLTWVGAPSLEGEAPIMVVASRPLEAALRDVGSRPVEAFLEEAWAVGGAPVWNGPEGDLILLCTDFVPFEGLDASPTHLDISPEAKRKARAAMLCLKGPSTVEEVGWCHTHCGHHINESWRRAGHDIQETKPPEDAPADARFFSSDDRNTMLEDYGAGTVGIVIDAGAARRDPTDVERCVASWVCCRALVVPCGFYLHPRLDRGALRYR